MRVVALVFDKPLGGRVHLLGVAEGKVGVKVGNNEIRTKLMNILVI
jgi:hypothetical protein